MSYPIRVLLVDDEPIFLEAVQALLDLDDRVAVVGATDNGERALELARDRRPDVALVDIRLPRVDGLEVMRRLLDEHGGLRVIALTGVGDEGAAKAAVAAGAAQLLLKGGLHDEIAEAIVAVSEQQTFEARA